jgi:hypothetical protein
MDIHFTAKIAGKIEKTKDLAVVEEWRNQGRLVLVGQSLDGRSYAILGNISMTKGKKEKKIRHGSDVADICLDLWRKGYKFKKTRTEEVGEVHKVVKFNQTLTSVADALEPTNAKKAVYFRNAVPYEIRSGKVKLLVVDFPTRGNSLKRTVEKFERLKKPSLVSVLHHGTNLRNVPSILKRGLRRSGGGMLGGGIYLGHLQKARNYSDLIIFEVRVVLGRCKEIVKVESLCNNEDYDSMHISSGKVDGVYKGWLANDEWIVRYPEQIEISRLICDMSWEG